MIAKVIDDRFPVVKDTKPELLAHHSTAARMADMAVPLWLKAGELSLARYAHPEALEHLKTGLALIPELSESIERDRTELAFHMAMASSHNATSGWASDETKAAYDGAKAIMDRIGADESQFDMLIGMFYFYNVRGFHDDAVPLIEEALRLLDAAGTDARRLVGYQAYGQSNLWRGHFTRSAEYFEKSMSVYDEEEHLALAQVWGADFYATDLAFLGMSYWALGFPERAWAASQGAFEHARHLDRPLVLAWVGGTATYGMLLQERFDEAIARSVECQKLARELDFHIMDASATLAEGCARIGLGDHDDGIRILQRGIEAWSGFGAQVHVPHARGFLAMGYAATGCYDDALTQINLGLGESRDGGEHWSDAELFRRHGDVQRMMGRSDEAASSFQHALEVARRQEAKGMELRAATSLVRLWCEQGERQKARDLLAPIYDWFTEGFDTKNLKDAKALLDELK